MKTHFSYRGAKHLLGGPTMKFIASLAVGAIALATAGAASAQDNLTLTGEAEKICELPSSWRFISSSYGAPAGGHFDTGSNTWDIPDTLLADTSGMGVASNTEVAIRIRGEAFCNTAHKFTLSSENGGLRADAAAVPGFANRRTMKYDAYWSDGSGGAYGGGGRTIQNFQPTVPGQTREANYNTDSFPPPGPREFDIRMGLQRNGPNIPPQPMLAGAYHDVLILTMQAL